MSRIIVLGGTGKVGRRIVELLELSGNDAVPASRNATHRFDWHDEGTWAPLLSGADRLFIVGPGSARDWSPRLAALLDLASRSRLKHAVLLSARGVEFLPDGAVDRAEKVLAAGPLPWTILRPSHFAQNFTEAMFMPSNGVISAPVGSGAEPFIDVLDIAEVAVRVLESPVEQFAGKTLSLSGPSAITFAEAARVLTEVSGMPVAFEAAAPAQHSDALRADGVPEGYIRWRMAMLGGIESGADAYVSEGVPEVLGRAATDFRSWAEREVPDSLIGRSGA